MSGRPGLFGGFRPGDAPERDVEFGPGSAAREGAQFIRLGDPRSGRDDGAFGPTSGFDPVWGTLGAPLTQPEDHWRATSDDGEVGPIADVEIFGDGFQISGRICTGQFPRLSDWLNMQQGFIRVQEASLAHLGHGNLPDPERQKGTLWVRLNQIVMVAELNVVAATATPTLPITWRTTLYRPVAAVMLGFEIVDSAAVLSATKIRLKPTPCHICGQNRSQ